MKTCGFTSVLRSSTTRITPGRLRATRSPLMYGSSAATLPLQLGERGAKLVGLEVEHQALGILDEKMLYLIAAFDSSVSRV